MKEEPTTENNTCFAVKICREDGSAFFASGANAITATFWKRSGAVQYKRELKQHRLRGKVVKVNLIVKEMP